MGPKYYGFVDSDIVDFLKSAPDYCSMPDIRKATGLSLERIYIELSELIRKGLVVRIGDRYSVG